MKKKITSRKLLSTKGNKLTDENNPHNSKHNNKFLKRRPMPKHIIVQFENTETKRRS